jgi:site-specific recombinase XerD
MSRVVETALVEAWLEFKRHNQGKAESTITKYRGYLARLQDYLTAHGSGLLQASVEQLENFTGLAAHEAGLSPRSRRALVAAVRGFFAWLHRTGRLPANPAAQLPYPRAGLRLPVAMGIDEAERLFMAPNISTFLGLRDAAILSLLIGCGLRVGGLVALNQSDVRFLRFAAPGTARRRGLGRERLVVSTTEKGGKERLVPAPHEARVLLRAYLEHDELKAIDRTLPDGDQVLFVTTMNRNVAAHEYHGEARRMSAGAIYDLVQRHGEAAGVPSERAHPHALRHLYGTELAEHDTSTLMIQALMGHADPKTSAIYTRLALAKLSEVVDRANPFRRIRSPVSDLIRELDRKT